MALSEGDEVKVHAFGELVETHGPEFRGFITKVREDDKVDLEVVINNGLMYSIHVPKISPLGTYAEGIYWSELNG